MPQCIQSAAVTGTCRSCGAREETMHRPVFGRGTFCSRCCPVCVFQKVATSEPAKAPLPTARILGVRPANTAEAVLGSQWKDAGWGPRADDPWYHDREQRDAPPRWVPRRPHWFK